jgi:hypothetical protein
MAVRFSVLSTGLLLPLGGFLALIFVRDKIDPKAIVRLEGLVELKYCTKSSGTEPADFLLVHSN